ncbi:MAG: plastocyanin/azurin family copper-binding protein [Halobacteria archaeon]
MALENDPDNDAENNEIDTTRRSLLAAATGATGFAAATSRGSAQSNGTSGNATGGNTTGNASGGNQSSGGGGNKSSSDGGNQSKGSSGGNKSSGDGGSGGKTHTVGMYSKNGVHYFDPIGLKISKGDTVKFVIKSGNHSSTAYKKGNGGAKNTLIPKGADAWDTGTLSGKGSSGTNTFNTKGTFDYFCIPHKQLGMTARIVVDKPGGPGEKFNSKVPSNNHPPEGKMPSSKEIMEQEKISFPYMGSSGGNGGGNGTATGSGKNPLPSNLRTYGLGTIAFFIFAVVNFFLILRYGSDYEEQGAEE